MEKKRMNFNIDATTVVIKDLLKKDFLELSLKAVNDECPNRKNTWFTYESLVDGKETFYNKPILGLFKNNDFTTHAGKTVKDVELGTEYWDTSGDGERCIGLIRESDKVEIVEDEKGLHWITLTCALWTNYSYAQVKRLIKDAINAQKTGEPTKNISIEVDIQDFENIKDENGKFLYTKINKFELLGITILGTYHGMKIEPGIEGAELSLLDNIITTTSFSKQMDSLRLAYSQLDSTEENYFNKEESEMDKIEGQTVTEPVKTPDPVQTPDPTITEDPTGAKFSVDPKEPTKVVDIEIPNPTEPFVDPDNSDENTKVKFDANPVYDLTYMIRDIDSCVKNLEESIQYYKDCGVIGGDYIIAVLEKYVAIHKTEAKEYANLLVKVFNSEKYVLEEEEIAFQKELATNCDCGTLYSKTLDQEKEISEIKEKFAKDSEEFTFKVKQAEDKLKECLEKYSDYEKISEELKNYKKQELLKNAQNYADTAKLTEGQKKLLFEDCEAGKYADDKEVKTAIALLCFENKEKENKTTSYQGQFSMPIVNKIDEAESSKNSKSKWDILKDYTKGKEK